LNKEYTREQYNEQFTTRVPELLAKLDRIEKEYRERVADAPDLLYTFIEDQRMRLLEAQERYGDCIPPTSFENDPGYSSN
ncbi:MAG: phosphoenolpyruvate carboxykinase, partial [Candidatus Thorarchaeota archaeon]